MGAAVRLRSDCSADDLRALARRSGDAKQTRRLLSLAEIYDGGTRGDAARRCWAPGGSGLGPMLKDAPVQVAASALQRLDDLRRGVLEFPGTVHAQRENHVQISVFVHRNVVEGEPNRSLKETEDLVDREAYHLLDEVVPRRLSTGARRGSPLLPPRFQWLDERLDLLVLDQTSHMRGPVSLRDAGRLGDGEVEERLRREDPFEQEGVGGFLAE